MAKNQRIKRVIDLSAHTVTFTVVSTGQVLVCNLNKIPGVVRLGSKSMMLRLIAHGVNAKVDDKGAAKNCDDYAVLVAGWETIVNGQWRESRAVDDSVIVEAIHRHYNKSLDDCRLAWENMSADACDTLKKMPKIKAHMAMIRAESKSTETNGNSGELADIFNS